MSKIIKDWSPYVMHWHIFMHLGMHYKTQINFGPKFEGVIEKHIEYLLKKDKQLGGKTK